MEARPGTLKRDNVIILNTSCQPTKAAGKTIVAKSMRIKTGVGVTLLASVPTAPPAVLMIAPWLHQRIQYPLFNLVVISSLEKRMMMQV